MLVRKAVIPAAGLGTRFLPASKAVPKEMLPILDKPTIQYIVEEVVEAGITELLIITRKDKECLADHFDRIKELEQVLEDKGDEKNLHQIKNLGDMLDIHFIRQKQPKGLGHAISYAKTFVGNEPFAVLLGDDVVRGDIPAIGQLGQAYLTQKKSILGVQEVPAHQVNLYGIVDYSSKEGHLYQVEGLVEKPPLGEAPSNLAVLGRYILTPAIFPILEQTPPGHGGEIQLTDALDILRQEEGVYAYHFQGKRYDVGQLSGYLQATVDFALAREELKEDFLAYVKEIISQENKRGGFYT